jgi:hypothetical protein
MGLDCFEIENKGLVLVGSWARYTLEYFRGHADVGLMFCGSTSNLQTTASVHLRVYKALNSLFLLLLIKPAMSLNPSKIQLWIMILGEPDEFDFYLMALLLRGFKSPENLIMAVPGRRVKTCLQHPSMLCSLHVSVTTGCARPKISSSFVMIWGFSLA